MSDKYNYKVFSATDGVHTIYSVTRRMTENAASQLSGYGDTIEETVELPAEYIASLGKMHVLTVKTGYDNQDILDALARTVSDSFITEYLSEYATDEDKPIIEQWLNK